MISEALPDADDPITDAQRALRPIPIDPRTPDEFRRVGRWWELEASRGRGSAARSFAYAQSMYTAAAARDADGTERPWTPGVDVLHESAPDQQNLFAEAP